MANYNIQHVKLPTFNFGNLSKNEAISGMVEVINDSKSEFTDHEEIIIRYTDVKGELSSVHCIVNLPEGEDANISVLINENDTLKIVETDEEPEDKESLWLTNWDEEHPEVSDLRGEVAHLKNVILEMQEIINRHDYALSNTLAGGDIIVNSEKYDLENRYKPEQPEDSDYKPSYDTEDTKIVSYDLYIANTPLVSYTIDDAHLYSGQKYYLKLRAFNIKGHEVDTSSTELSMAIYPSEVATINGNILYANVTGDTTFVSQLITEEGTELMHNYALRFEHEEKPDYETYSEPNVHHMLIKKADTREILEQNEKYLLECEFCWCVDENSLYLKAKAKNGTTQLFKINGQGSIVPTGETSITYTITENNILEMLDDTGEHVYIDENGILNLVGVIDSKGILNLVDTSPNE